MKKYHVKDPGSAVTHSIGCLLAVFASIPLLIRAIHTSSPIIVTCCAIFIFSMILLYAASAVYHTFDISEKINKILRKIDHMMIFVLIAGTYTPVCVIAIGGNNGYKLLILVWALAIVGMALKAFWVTCPKWVSSVIYIGMGWICVLAFSELYSALQAPAFWWLLAGGIIYTVGGIIYALKLPVFNGLHKNFGSHEIFHLFVMAGSLCHFIFIYQYVVFIPLS